MMYVGTPYSLYEDGLENAFVEAAKVTAELLRRGIPVFSPITHSHPIARYGNIDPLDHKIWLALDEHMMRAADALLVIKMPGWEESYGIKHEVAFFEAAHKMIYYYSWPDLRMETFDEHVKVA